MAELIIGVVNILFFVTLTSFLARQYKITFSRMLPFSCAILLLLLLLLAVFNILNLIDYISLGFIIFYVVVTLIKKEAKSISIFEILFFIITISFLYFLCRNHSICHSDELRYWGLETKTIYFANGFSQKGMDPGYLYGSYHPGLVLFMWWFCHFCPSVLSEGLMFVGYWVLFSIPIISVIGEKVTKKNFVLLFLITIFLIICVPTIVNETNYDCISAELPMASFFALLLLEMFQNENQRFQIPYCASLVVALVLLKSTGFLWALVCLVIGFIRNKNRKEVIIPCLSGAGISVFWKVYCLCMNRTSYYTSQVKDILDEIEWSGKKPLVEDFFGYAKSYIHTYINEPLNISGGGLLNLSAVGFLVAIIIILFLFVLLQIIKKKDGIILTVSYITIQLIFSIVLIFMCAFVFREDWYLEPECLINILSRYGTVVFTGILLLIAFFACGWNEVSLIKKRTLVGSLVTLLALCSNYRTLESSFVDTNAISEYAATRKNEVNNRYSDVFQNRENGKIAIIIENENDDWIEDRYLFIQYCGVPMKIFIERIKEEELEGKITELKNQYGEESVYVYGF